MPEEFEGDLAGAVFWGADLRGARFRDVNLGEARISHAWLTDVEIDAFIDRVVVNGVDVTAFVNDHDPWFPLRTVLRVSDPDSMRTGWSLLRSAWEAMVVRARRRPDDDCTRRSTGSGRSCRRCATSCSRWTSGSRRRSPADRSRRADCPTPARSSSPGRAWTSTRHRRSTTSSPSGPVRTTRFDDHLAAITAADLDRSVDVLENGPHRVRDCIATVFEEEFWHLRYADRDLAVLEAAG